MNWVHRCGRRWLLVATMAPPMSLVGCSDPAADSKSEGASPDAPSVAGKAAPAPKTELAYARAVLAALHNDDWEGYTNLLSNRADMMGLYSKEPTHRRRDRRKRRRAIWRRINRLRKHRGKEAWGEVLAEAKTNKVQLRADAMVRLWSEPASGRMPESANAVRLVAEIEGPEDERHWLDMGTCAQASRGWITLSALRWTPFRPDDEATLLFGEPLPTDEPE